MQRFVHIVPKFADTRLPAYVLQRHRKVLRVETPSLRHGTAANLSPVLDQRTVSPQYRIQFRHRNAPDVREGVFAFFGCAVVHVRMPSAGISAYDAEICGRTDAFVCNSRWNHYNVSSANLHIDSALAAQPDSRGATVHSKHFVRGAVIVVIRKNPVAPRTGPVELAKPVFDLRRIRRKSRVIKKDGHQTVWNDPVIAQPMYLNRILVHEEKLLP